MFIYTDNVDGTQNKPQRSNIELGPVYRKMVNPIVFFFQNLNPYTDFQLSLALALKSTEMIELLQSTQFNHYISYKLKCH